MAELISINEAAAAGIERIRMPIWANREDHLKIDIIQGSAGPWLHLYSPTNEIIDMPNPQTFLGIGQQDYNLKEFEIYEGTNP